MYNCETCDGTGRLIDPSGAFPGDRVSFEMTETAKRQDSDPVNWFHIVERNVKSVAAKPHLLGSAENREASMKWLDESLTHNHTIANQIERQIARCSPEAIEAILSNESAIHGQIRLAISNLEPDEVGESNREYQQLHGDGHGSGSSSVYRPQNYGMRVEAIRS